jgi:aspartate/methionine/tyrosine aminotransferase
VREARPCSRRLQKVQTPVIPVVARLIRENPGTISLGQGVVSYPPPPQATKRIREFLADSENHKYKPVQGIPSLVTALQEKLATENRIRTEPQRIFVTAGGNLAFANALLAIADPGDEVILLTPYYFNHEMAITMASCKPVLVPTDARYQLRPDLIAGAITSRTKAVVTISPNNPSGAVYPEETLRAVNELCRARGVYHIHDEAYEYFTYGAATHFSPGSIDGAGDYTISLYSLSKAYGFASWRIGYMVVPPHLIEAINKIQDTILICAPVISQYAALGALAAGPPYCAEKLKGIAEIRELMLRGLAGMNDLCEVPPADGAFYFLLRLKTDLDSMTVVERLIRAHRVALIPGSTFGLEAAGGFCHVRLAYAALTRENAQEGLRRLTIGLRALTARPGG